MKIVIDFCVLFIVVTVSAAMPEMSRPLFTYLPVPLALGVTVTGGTMWVILVVLYIMRRIGLL